jgi:Holliday junction resolvase RusA-like endonuclease
MITFFVAGDPVGQPRARAFAMRSKSGRALVRMYDAGTADGWRRRVSLAAKQYLPKQPHDGAMAIRMEFYFARPKSHYATRGLRTNAPSMHTQKPDADNLAKAVLDELTRAGMWHDDTQVTDLQVQKAWDEQGGCQITIWHVPHHTPSSASPL